MTNTIVNFQNIQRALPKYRTEKQAVAGKFKDEFSGNIGKIITEFVGLRSKLYSLTVQDDKEKKVCKGCKKMCDQ